MFFVYTCSLSPLPPPLSPLKPLLLLPRSSLPLPPLPSLYLLPSLPFLLYMQTVLCKKDPPYYWVEVAISTTGKAAALVDKNGYMWGGSSDFRVSLMPLLFNGGGEGVRKLSKPHSRELNERVHVYIYMYVCMHVCMYVCTHFNSVFCS